ncbi:MAG: CHASE domain-containing protein [Hyphomicrobiaceae bacterium]
MGDVPGKAVDRRAPAEGYGQSSDRKAPGLSGVGAFAHGLRPYLPTVVVLVLMLVLAAVFAWMARVQVMVRADAAFKLEVRSVQDAIQDVIRTYAQSLRAGSGLVDASHPITRRDWSIFVRSLALPQNFPGGQGIGFARVLKSSEIDALVAQQRREGVSTFTFHPVGDRETYTAIVYLEPDDWRNRRALGFDMFSEPIRRRAMERARDRAEPILSHRVTLLQEAGSDAQPGTLLYMPVYHGGGTPTTLEARRRLISGWVYGVFRMHDLFRRTLARHAAGSSRHLWIEIFDGDSTDRDALLFDSLQDSAAAAVGREGRSRAQFVSTSSIELAGVSWTLRATSLSDFEKQVDGTRHWTVLAIGFACSVLLGGLSALLDFWRNRYATAERRLLVEVSERKRAEDEARIANQELIHRVKNTLAIVTAIASQTGRHAKSIEDFNAAFRSRLVGLARVQDLLRPDAASSPDLSGFARDLLAPFVGQRSSALAIEGPALRIGHSEATLLSLVLNELATNATKYGAWSVAEGKVRLSWQIETQSAENVVVLVWHESGGPRIETMGPSGFGSSVMRVVVERGLRGRISTDVVEGGLRQTIILPRGEGSTLGS